MATVSVIMPFFNVGAYLERSVASLRAQSCPDWELIAVDDASTDDSFGRFVELAKGDDRIKLHRLEQNGGPSAARNLGIGVASGEWVAVLDADDAFDPVRLETFLNIGRSADMVLDNLSFWDEELKVVSGTAFPAEDRVSKLHLRDLIESEAPDSKFKFGFLKPMIRRRFLEEACVRYDERLRFSEDFDLYARCLLKGAAAFLMHRPLYLYTRQTGQVSGAQAGGTRTVFNPHSRVDLAKRLLEDFGKSASCEDGRLLRCYQSWQTMYAAAYELALARKRWDLIAFAKLTIRHPLALWRFATTSRFYRKLAGSAK